MLRRRTTGWLVVASAALVAAACSAGGTDIGADDPGFAQGGDAGASIGGSGGGSAAGQGQGGASSGASADVSSAGGESSAGGATAGASGSSSQAGAAGVAGVANGGAGAAGATAGSGGAAASGASGHGGGETAGSGGSSGAGGVAASGSAGASGASGSSGKSGAGQGGAAGFAACATGDVAATTTLLPVDIIWVVDNSASMAPSVTQLVDGINDFASQIGNMSFDYRVIMLSLQGTGTMTIDGKTRYPVCVPPPLAGDSACGDGPRFFDADVDVKSTQPLEQLLGTLGQATGYTAADGPNMNGSGHGGRPWKDQLRPTSTKNIVVVTDDDSRLSADDFLHFAGGTNPNNPTYVLPPGILDPSWNGLFDSWVVNGILGAPDTDSTVVCKYPDGSTAANPPLVYAALISESQGKRRSICDGASAWTQFFADVIGEVVTTAKIDCTVPVPTPPAGQTLDPMKVNLSVDAGGSSTSFFHVDDAASCDPMQGGWYYDSNAAPTTITLCSASCAAANQAVGANKSGALDVTFGCATIEKP